MTITDALVQDYLARLERATAGMDGERRDELLAGIGEHIQAARAAGVADDEAAVRTLLDRLGEPEVIVAAAGDSGAPSRPGDLDAHRLPRRRGTGLELAAVLMLTAGSFLPVVGWLVGAVLLWCSDRWRTGEKILGTLVVPLGGGGVLLFGGALPYTISSCTTSSGELAVPPVAGNSEVTTCMTNGLLEWGVPVLLVMLLLASVAVPVWLYRSARRRADAELEPALRP